MSWLVTTVTVPQVVECIFTFPSKGYWHVWGRIVNRVEDWSIFYLVADPVYLHSDLSCLSQIVIFS